MSNAPKNIGNHDANTWVDEIDIDDMTGEIARTLLACEEFQARKPTSPKTTTMNPPGVDFPAGSCRLN